MVASNFFLVGSLRIVLPLLVCDFRCLLTSPVSFGVWFDFLAGVDRVGQVVPDCPVYPTGVMPPTVMITR